MESHCFKLHRSYLISFNLSNFGEIFWIESEKTVSKLRKKKRKFLCCVHPLDLEEGGEIKKFHVAVVQQRPRNDVQKKRDARASCSITNLNLLLFCCCRAPYCCDPETYHSNVTSHFSSLFSLKVVERVRVTYYACLLLMFRFRKIVC